MKFLKLILFSCLSLLSFDMYAPPAEAQEGRSLTVQPRDVVEVPRAEQARYRQPSSNDSQRLQSEPINRSNLSTTSQSVQNKSAGGLSLPEVSDDSQVAKKSKSVSFGENQEILIPTRSEDKTAALLAKYKISDTSDVNAIDKDGFTALYKASSLGRNNDVQALIEAGADVNQKNANGKTAFDLASHDNNTTLMELLKKNGAIDTSVAEKEKLNKAAVPKTKSILDHISDAWNSFTKSISDFFTFGSKAKQKEVATDLSDFATDVTKQKIPNAVVIAPIESNMASRQNDRENNSVNLEEHAKQAVADYNELAVLKGQKTATTPAENRQSEALENSLYQELTDMVVASQGDSEMTSKIDTILDTMGMKQSIHQQADVEIARINSDQAAKNVAKDAGIQEPSTPAPSDLPEDQFIADQKANLGSSMDKVLSSHTMLDSKGNLVDLTGNVISAKPTHMPVDPRTIDHTANLRTAVNSGDHAAVVKALRNGANPNAQDEDGYTALHDSVQSGNADITKSLIDAKADPNIKNKYGANSLHYAVDSEQVENPDIVKSLIKGGVDVNEKDANGFTPLQHAQGTGKVESAQLLTNAGAHNPVAPLALAQPEENHDNEALASPVSVVNAPASPSRSFGVADLQNAKLKPTVGPVKQPVKPNVLSQIKEGRALSPVKSRPESPKVESATGLKGVLEAGFAKKGLTQGLKAADDEDDDADIF